jgi:hypothetical protein
MTAAHAPDGLGWFTNTAHPKADIVDWCRAYPGLRVEIGPPMVSAVTFTAEQMRAKRPRIVGLYVTSLPDLTQRHG